MNATTCYMQAALRRGACFLAVNLLFLCLMNYKRTDDSQSFCLHFPFPQSICSLPSLLLLSATSQYLHRGCLDLPLLRYLQPEFPQLSSYFFFVSKLSDRDIITIRAAPITMSDNGGIMSDHDLYIKFAKNAKSVESARGWEQKAHKAAAVGGFEPDSLTSADIKSIARREHDSYINMAKDAYDVGVARIYERRAHQAAAVGEFEPYSLTSADIESIFKSIARREHR
ncbi:hypothetical protein HDV63DRAFT_386699 [Trichoderma sp. SZMC 28014]